QDATRFGIPGVGQANARLLRVLQCSIEREAYVHRLVVPRPRPRQRRLVERSKAAQRLVEVTHRFPSPPPSSPPPSAMLRRSPVSSQDAPISPGPDLGVRWRGSTSPSRGGRRGEETEMVRIIDMECSIPRTEASEPEPGHSEARSAKQPAGYGMANYGRIFRSRQEGSDHRPEMDLDAYVEKLGKLGIVRSVPFGVTNDEEAALLRRYPDRFLGLARISINAFKGMTGVRELERLVREEGFVALGVSALVDCIAASDRRYYPLYTKAAELGIPVRIYS